MSCPKCSSENPVAAKFCGECGAPLPIPCPACGHANLVQHKFCTECGVALEPGQHLSSPDGVAETGSPKSVNTSHLRADGQRRQLTVMFCDLVGSTALSERLDPEDLREVIRAYQRMASEAIQQYDGQIQKYIGDGLLVYFGFPIAHEDDARRAVLSALGIVNGLKRLNQDAHGPSTCHLEVHIGIHTGLVVVGEMGGGEVREAGAIVGETPNIAARLEALAPPGAILISEATHHLLGHQFACDALGPRPVKGITNPISLYRVVGEQLTDEPQVLQQTPMVGREHEVELLCQRWEQA